MVSLVLASSVRIGPNGAWGWINSADARQGMGLVDPIRHIIGSDST